MIKNVLYVMGAVFIIVGLIGFFNHPVLGLFEVNALHNWIHIISGVLALIFAMRDEASARTFSLVLGVVYGLVTVLGFVAQGNILGLMHVNMADNILHLLLTVIFLWAGLMKPSTATRAAM